MANGSHLELIMRVQPAKEDESRVVEDANHSAVSVVSLHDQVLSLYMEEPSSVVTLGKTEIPGPMNLVGQPSPPVLVEVQDVVVVAPSQVSDPISVNATSLEDELIRAEAPFQVHISTNLMDMFMKLLNQILTETLKPVEFSQVHFVKQPMKRRYSNIRLKNPYFPLDGFIHTLHNLVSCHQLMSIPITRIRLCCLKQLLLKTY